MAGPGSGSSSDVVTTSELIAYLSIDPTTGGQRPGQPPAASTSTNQKAGNGACAGQRKPGTNLAEIDPMAFAQTLTHRLEKVKESRGKMEKLLSKMQPVSRIYLFTWDAQSRLPLTVPQ